MGLFRHGKSRKKASLRCGLLAVTLLLSAGMAFSAHALGYDAYVYSYEGAYKKSLPIYIPAEPIDLNRATGLMISKAKDIAFDTQGRMYLADAGNHAIHVLDSAFRLVKTIVSFSCEGKEEHFNQPSGVYVSSEGTLYIADTENSRIVVLDGEGNYLRMVESPQGTGITDSFIFKPIAVTADASGRIYAVSQASNMGVLSFTAAGEFEGFLGAQVVTPSAVELLWRMFMTEAQRERSKTNIPVDYNDIAVDSEGFLFVTSASIDKEKQYNALMSGSTASDYAPVKRLNPSGDDILRRNGFYPPGGDLDVVVEPPAHPLENAASAFISAAPGRLGVYSVADATNQKIFTYDAQGNLLCAFGGEGSSPGRFSSLTAVAYRGDELVVLDAMASSVTVFRLSDYGSKVMQAIGYMENRQYDLALQSWQELLPLNANLDTVYVDLGKAYLRSRDWDDAMYYFRLVGDKENYSRAFAQKRSESLGLLIVLIPLSIAALAVGLKFLFGRIRRLNEADDGCAAFVPGWGAQLRYGFYILFHPFNGFYNAKRHRRGGWRGAGTILGLAAAVWMLSGYLSGYLFSLEATKEDGLFLRLFQFLFPLLLFVLANFCVTSLLDGEGSLRDVTITVCYALLPLVLLLPLGAVIANFLSLEESVIRTLIQSVAYGWTGLLMVFGLLTIHGYSLKKTLLSLLLTLLGVVILLFILLMLLTMSQRLIAFIQSVVTELSYRLL